MSLTLAEVRDLLARRAAGEVLGAEQLAALTRSARLLHRRLARLQALDPDTFADIALGDELAELAGAELASGSA